MGRLIDADELIPLIKMGEMNTYDDLGRGRNGGIDFAVERIKQMPTIEERKNGEWEEIEVIADAYDIRGVKTWASKMKCDQCGFTTIAIEGHFSQYNFCPNCGSYNGGEDNGKDT